MIQLVGLSGKANIGKDHIASILRQYGYFPFSFALHFKMDMVGKKQLTYEEVMVTKPPHVRNLIQRKGTEEGRNIYGEDVWVDTVESWLRFFYEYWGMKLFVIPDIRFKNEADYIKSNGGKVYRIKSDGRIVNSKLTTEQKEHISETALDELPDSYFDGIIQNNIDTQNTHLIEQIEHLLQRK